jgi:hypothetical protein
LVKARREAAKALHDDRASEKQEREVAHLAAGIISQVELERERRNQLIEQLIIEGTDSYTIWRVGRERFPTLTHDQVRHQMEKIRIKWREENRFELEVQRYASLERLHMLRRGALGEQPPNRALALKCEKEINRLLGVVQPPKQQGNEVHIHSHALMAVIGGIDPEQAAALLEEQKEQERLAQVARTLLPAVVTVEPEKKG